MTFSVHEPTGRETPVVVEIPHAGLGVDPESLAWLISPARAIGQDADLFVDELYADAPRVGASLLVAHTSRYVCDLNRSETDVDGLAVQGGPPRPSPHGLIWRTTTDNQPALGAPIPAADLARRLDRVYRPYHEALRGLLQAKVERFGHAVLLCAHSMPSFGRTGHGDTGSPRADVVPGSRGRTSAAPTVIDTPDVLAREFGWTVAHDDPYRGGHTTAYYGRPDLRVHAVQVELARRLYMNERSLTRKAIEFERVRGFCRVLMERLGALGLH